MMSYLVQLLFSASLLLLAATCASLLFRRKSASFRYKLWNFTMLGLLLLPFLLPFLPQQTLGLVSWTFEAPVKSTLPSPYYLTDDIQYFPAQPVAKSDTEKEWERWWILDQPVNAEETTVSATPEMIPAPAPPVKHIPVIPESVPAEQDRFNFLSLIVEVFLFFCLVFWPAIWIIATVILTLRMLLSLRSARKLLGRMLPVEKESVTILAEKIAKTMGVYRPIEILQSEAGTVPFTLGMRRPKIVLPSVAVENWSESQLRAILTHEIAHIQRGDVWGQLLTQFVFCLYWFHPLVWFAARQIRVTRELACDDMVLLGGEEPADFATMLLELANSFSSKNRFALGCGVAMFERKNLVRKRITSILNNKVYRVPVGIFTTLVLFVFAAIGVTFASMLSPLTGEKSEKLIVREFREKLKALEPTLKERITISQLRQTIYNQNNPEKAVKNPASPLKELDSDQICLEMRCFAIDEARGKAILADKVMEWTGLPVPGSYGFTKDSPSKKREESPLIPNQSDPKPGLCSLTTVAPMPLHVRFMGKNSTEYFINIFQNDSKANILSAPKVTFFSGVSWCVYDITDRPFVTSVVPVEGDETTAYQPIIEIFAEGTIAKGKATLLEDHSCRIDSCVVEFAQIQGTETVELQLSVKHKSKDFVQEDGVSIQVPTVRSFCISIPEIVIPEGMSMLVAVPGITQTSNSDPTFLMVTPQWIESDM